MATKQSTNKQPKKTKNIPQRTLVLARTLAELVAVYIFATQDNTVLFALAGIFAVDAAIVLVDKFLVK